MDFNDAAIWLKDAGLMDTLFPFILIFTVVFAILSKVNLLGAGRKGMNIVVAAILALTSVMMHVLKRYPADKDPINIMNESLPIAIGVVVAILAFLFIISLMEGEAKLRKFEIGSFVIGLSILFFINFAFPSVPFWIALLSAFIIAVKRDMMQDDSHHGAASYTVFFIIIGIIYIFGSKAGYFGELPYWMEDTFIQYVVITVLVFVGVAYFISRGGDT